MPLVQRARVAALSQARLQKFVHRVPDEGFKLRTKAHFLSVVLVEPAEVEAIK